MKDLEGGGEGRGRGARVQRLWRFRFENLVRVFGKSRGEQRVISVRGIVGVKDLGVHG